jgi:hypothetical protein
MALIPETGEGLSNANTYISLADANTYWTERGSPSEWDSANVAEKSAALLYATAWLDDNFRWYSYVYKTTQSLGWPRYSYFDDEGREVPSATVHQKIKDATCEMALNHLKGNINSSDNEGIKSEKLGDASITYSGGSSSKSYSFIKVGLRQYGIPKAINNSIYRS